MDDDIEDSTPNAAASANGRSATVSSSRFQANPDRASAASPRGTTRTGVVQPKPQALPKRTGPTSIIVSPRQKGNPVLNHVKGIAWEYGDIPADYLLGATTCALFLSLKYHKLHPEYIYNRIKALAGKYSLRIVLVMVDVQNHEDSLKELSKTSLINNVTLVLCWSAAEGGRYLELFKTYEHAAPTSIKQHQSTTYADRMINFITSPRSINKTDAVSLVSQFGTVRTAVNAQHEDVSGIAGWGEKKVKQWCGAVREPFRIQRAAKRGAVLRLNTVDSEVDSDSLALGKAPPIAEGEYSDDSVDRSEPGSEVVDTTAPISKNETDSAKAVSHSGVGGPEMRTVEGIMSKISPKELPALGSKRKPDEDLSEGIMAALSKLRREDR